MAARTSTIDSLARRRWSIDKAAAEVSSRITDPSTKPMT